ncbi:MAG: response regulator [Verrucomicrobiota bacterium]
MAVKVLIIEDDPVILLIYKTQLERAGFEVQTAISGEAGFLRLHQNPPDAIVLDLMLPKANGVEILKCIRAQKQFEKIPIFILTAVPQSDLAKNTLLAGANKVLGKSDTIPLDIVDAILEALDQN